MSFNDQKSKVTIITKKKPKIRRDFEIFLNNKKLQQGDTVKYLGITIDRRFNFNQHIHNITGKCIKIIHALSKSAKINWGLRHDILRIIYTGAILPILSYGAPVWIEGLKRKHNATKLKKVQRLINIKIARAYRTTSHEALCVLTGITPILIEMRSQAKIYHNTQGNMQIRLYDAPKLYSKWNHPADAIELKEKCEGREYMIQIYTDGCKSSSDVGSGIAIFVNKQLTLQLMYKLAEECSNNQAKQLTIVKALEKLQDFRHLLEGQQSAAIHTDSNGLQLYTRTATVCSCTHGQQRSAAVHMDSNGLQLYTQTATVCSYTHRQQRSAAIHTDSSGLQLYTWIATVCSYTHRQKRSAAIHTDSNGLQLYTRTATVCSCTHG